MAHTTAELILDTSTDMVSTVVSEATASELKAIPLSNNNISRHICYLSADMEGRLFENMKDGRFALKMNEETIIKTVCCQVD